jgi:hypothetical protein
MAQNRVRHFCAIFFFDRRTPMSRRIYAAPFLAGLIFLSALATTCNTMPLPNIPGAPLVADAVLAKDFESDAGTPVDVTTEYAPDQKNFHLVVTVNDTPKDTKFKTIWTAVDIGGTMPPNTKLEERELIVTGSGTFEFAIAPKTGQWAAGKYKVDLLVNNKIDRTLNFTVAGAIAARAPTPTPTQAKCPAPTTPPLKPSGLISKVVLAESTDAFHNPVNPTTLFKSPTVIHAVIFYENAPVNTRLRDQWYAIDVGNASSCNQAIHMGEFTTSGDGVVDLYIEDTPKWPPGSYRLEIYANGKLDQVVNFSVKE